MVYNFLMVPIINHLMDQVCFFYVFQNDFFPLFWNIVYKSYFELLLWFISIYSFLNEERDVETLHMPTDRSIWIFPHLANFPLRIWLKLKS